MKFVPSPEDKDAPTSQEHAQAAQHTRSILRFPSLATPSVDSTGQPESNAPVGNTDANKSTTTNDFSNWPVHTKTTTTTTTEGRPVFVNAENDRFRGGGVRVLHGMPPYSPIRIRSSRGGSRMVGRPTTGKVQRHGYPVSTRGRRRVGVANRSIDESSSSVAAAAAVSHGGTVEVPLKMLEKEQVMTVETPEKDEATTDESESAETSTAKSVDETTQPRSVLKRRLPLSRETSKSSGLGEQDDEQDNAIKPSLSNSSSGSSSSSESTSGSTSV